MNKHDGVMYPYGDVITENMIREGYLYSLWSGRFKVYHGRVKPRSRDGICNFITDEGKLFQCNPEPGMFHNALVWLEDNNETLARELLVDHENRQIAKLQEQIDNHLYKIKVLKSGL
jgi:hypothetical protein